MGTTVQVIRGYVDILLPYTPAPKYFSGGQSTTLTDNEFAALPASVLQALLVTATGLPDPLRPPTPPVSLEDALQKSVTYTNLMLPRMVLGWAVAQSYVILSATRDANEAITVASVQWPDGSAGTFTTDTASTLFPGAVDAYHVTYGSPLVNTYTQPLVTRDTGGAVTAQPAIVVT